MLFHIKIEKSNAIIKHVSIVRKYINESISELKSKILNSQFIYEIDSGFYNNDVSLKLIEDLELAGAELKYFICDTEKEVEVNKSKLLEEIQKTYDKSEAFKNKVLYNWGAFEADLLSEIEEDDEEDEDNEE